MVYRIHATIALFCVILVEPPSAKPVDDGSSSYHFVSTVKARAIGMGASQTATIDGFSSCFYNPATLGLRVESLGPSLTFHFNPVGAYAALRYRDRLSDENTTHGLDWLTLAGLFAKSITYSTRSFTVALVLSEELTSNPEHMCAKVIAPEGILDWNMNSLSGRLRLANQISIGASGYLVTTRPLPSTSHEYCFSYGVLIQPTARLSVGLSYFDFPRDVETVFFLDSRLVDETINVGLCYNPSPVWTFSLDLRNVAEDTAKAITRELHLGFEVSPFPFLAVRGGYYQQEDDGRSVYSAGLGLFNDDGRKEHFIFRFLTINYGLRAIELLKEYDLQHFMTVLLSL